MNESARAPDAANIKSTPKRKLRLFLKWVFYALGGVAAVVILSIIGLIGSLNTGWGREFAVKQIALLSGQTIEIRGLRGTFPQAIKLDALSLHDAKGPWITLYDAQLDWHPWAIFARTASISRLHIASIQWRRMPVPDAVNATVEEGKPRLSHLHLLIKAKDIFIQRLSLSPALGGKGSDLQAHGRLDAIDLAEVLNAWALKRLPHGILRLDVTRLDAPGTIHLALALQRKTVQASLVAQEPAEGLLTQYAGLPQCDPLSLNLGLDGPRDNIALKMSANIGPLAFHSLGKLDLRHKKGELDVDATSAAFTPYPGYSWQHLDMRAHLFGNFSSPQGRGQLNVAQLDVTDQASMRTVSLSFDARSTLSLTTPLLHFHLREEGLKLAMVHLGEKQSEPLRADVTIDPNRAGKPVNLALTHPLININAKLVRTPYPHVDARLTLPDLAPVAALGGQVAKGHASAQFSIVSTDDNFQNVKLNAAVQADIDKGQTPLEKLLGPSARVALNLAFHRSSGVKAKGYTIDVTNAAFDSQALHFIDHGRLQSSGCETAFEQNATLSIPDVAALTPSARGRFEATLQTKGVPNDFLLSLKSHGKLGFGLAPEGALSLEVNGEHLPRAPYGNVLLKGDLDRAPVALNVGFATSREGVRTIILDKFAWRGAMGRGKLAIGQGHLFPTGDVTFTVPHLNELSDLAAQKLEGNLALDVHTQSAPRAQDEHVNFSANGRVASSQFGVKRVALKGTVTDPEHRPFLNAKLDLDKVAVKCFSGDLHVSARGAFNALMLGLDAQLRGASIEQIQSHAKAQLNLDKKEVNLTSFVASVPTRGTKIVISKPSNIKFGAQIGVDLLDVAIRQQGLSSGRLTVSGVVSPQLALQARLTPLDLRVIQAFLPTFPLSGSMNAKANLRGSSLDPLGEMALNLDKLRLKTELGAALPPFSVRSTANLSNHVARVTFHLRDDAKTSLAIAGGVPLKEDGQLSLHANGNLDLSAANAFAGSDGMSVGGGITVSALLGGTLRAPIASGEIALHDVKFNDFVDGIRLSAMSGKLIAQHDRILLQDIRAKAGKGEIVATGMFGVLQPGMPLAITLQASNAEPIQSDLFTAQIDAQLHLSGHARSGLQLNGTIDLPNVSINIPNAMPASIPQLELVWPGQKQASQNAALPIRLDLTVTSPGEFFVRGHGLDAEMMGKLHIGGMAHAPQIDGGFDLRRGNFNLGGVNLTFTRGRVGFNGSGITHQLDPSLDFRADRNVQGTLASLNITGYASAPKITFTSVPSLPRDQVLAMLLFGSTTTSLSTAQMAELASAVGQLSGVTSFDPISTLRNFLGLDRLAVGGGSGVNNGGTSVEAGKYVLRNVYVGAKQATSGSGTQAQVQIDLTKNLKIDTTVGTGGQVTGFTTPENDPGSSVGVSYGFRY